MAEASPFTEYIVCPDALLQLPQERRLVLGTQAVRLNTKLRTVTMKNHSGRISLHALLSKIADICLSREMFEEADPQLL